VFFELRDGSGVIQCVVFNGDVSENTFDLAKNLTIETSMTVYGAIRRDKRSKIGYEINVSNLEIIHRPVEEYPISPKEHGVAFLHENRHLWLRSSRQLSIHKIRSTIIKSSRDFLDSQGFMCFDAPIFTPVACEGTTSLFKTKYFDSDAYLTQSGQLYNEAGAMAYGRVYSFGPTFRAEKSKTRRHLTEFWMVEPEAAFYDLDKAIDLAQNFVAFIIKNIVETNKNDLEILERDISKLESIEAPFPTINYDDAISLLKDNKSDIEWGNDLGAEHETIISQNFDRPVIIQRYPSICKAFYMKNAPERPDTVLCFDMIAPEGYGEIIGGGQREDDYETLKQKILDNDLSLDNFDWYLDLRKYGSVPHAGFGLGIERLVAWACGINHVRETIPFPRLMDRIKP
ncbi:asparagine--tRNA ligase, partial [Candidatus Latescibacterota bacterium]